MLEVHCVDSKDTHFPDTVKVKVSTVEVGPVDGPIIATFLTEGPMLINFTATV